ncbi:MAG: DUF47 family protein [Planctomycetota bacterium]
MATIGGLFGRNVFGPIHEHLLKIEQCAYSLRDLLARFSRGEETKALAAEVRRIEGEADRIKNEARRKMTHSMWSAVERSETIALLGKQDDIADGAAEIARLVEARATRCPTELAGMLEQWTGYISRGVEALTTEVKKAYDSSDKPAEGPASAGGGEALWGVLAEEEASDRLHQEFLVQLFALERTMDPVSIVLFLEMRKSLQSMTGAIQNTAGVLQRLLEMKK